MAEQIRTDEAVEIAVEHALRISDLEAGAMVLHELVRLEDVAADLAAEADVLRLAALAGELGLALLLAELRDARPEDAQRRLLVGRLGALVLALDDDAGRQVRQPDRGIRLVDVLAAGAARPVRVDPQLRLVDLHCALVGQQRSHDHLGEARVAAVRLVEGRQANEPVDAALGLEDPVGVLAADGHRRGLEAGLLARARLEELRLEAAVGGPAQVHPQQDLGPVLSVGASRAGMDRDDGVSGVVLAGEERVLLEALELAMDRSQGFGDLVRHLAVHGEELTRVLVLAAQPVVPLEAPREAGVLGGDSRRPLLVVPESRLTELALELGHARPQRVGVKGNHGPSRAGPRSPSAAPRRPESGRARAYAPWHFLNFLPEPHQHGSLRPSFCSSVVRRVIVPTAPPPPPTGVIDAAVVPVPAAAPAAAIACEPASDSCS